MSGILNSDDDKDETSGGGGGGGDENDEILAELKKKQAELRALSHQNTIMLRHLHKQAKDELHSQQLKKNMAAADSEVSSSYGCKSGSSWCCNCQFCISSCGSSLSSSHG